MGYKAVQKVINAFPDFAGKVVVPKSVSLNDYGDNDMLMLITFIKEMKAITLRELTPEEIISRWKKTGQNPGQKDEEEG